MEWVAFAIGVVAVAVVGWLLLRRMSRWTPTDGSSSEAGQARARLFAVRFGGERR